MQLRKVLFIAAGAVLASRVAAQGATGDSQPPPSDRSRTWYEKDAQKARELGQKGAGAVKKGASAAGKKVNAGGQAATAKVVGTRSLTGRISQVSQDQVTVRKSDGTPMSLRVVDSTKVTIGGQKGSIGSLQQGDEVRASYVESGGSATARKLDVKRTSEAGSSSAPR